jgi:hypothetical protein
MEATCSSETSFDFQRTTRRYTPEDTVFSQEDDLATANITSNYKILKIILKIKSLPILQEHVTDLVSC